MRWTVVAVMMVFLSGTAAAADEPAVTAEDLYGLCAGTDHVSVNSCRIYILGVTQGLALGLSIADGKTKTGRSCVPSSVSAETLEETLKKKLEADLSASPEHRSRDAAAFIARVLASSYPCAK